MECASMRSVFFSLPSHSRQLPVSIVNGASAEVSMEHSISIIKLLLWRLAHSEQYTHTHAGNDFAERIHEKDRKLCLHYWISGNSIRCILAVDESVCLWNPLWSSYCSWQGNELPTDIPRLTHHHHTIYPISKLFLDIANRRKKQDYFFSLHYLIILSRESSTVAIKWWP